MSDIMDNFDEDLLLEDALGSGESGELVRSDIFESEEQRDEVVRYVLDEADAILSGEEHSKMAKMWQTWRRQRESRPESEHKSYPWTGASNVSVPLAMTNGNGIFALLKSSIGARKPMFNVSCGRADMDDGAKALEALLDKLVESPYHLNLRDENDAILYDLATLGTQFVKVPWIRDQWQYKRTGESGGEETILITRKDSPAIVPVALEDFICRPYYDDIQRAPMIGHKLTLFEHELRQRSAAGIYEHVDKVLEGGGEVEIPEEKRDSLSRMGIEMNEGRDRKQFTIYEVYLFHDIDGDGIPEDIILWIDPVTEVVLRSEFNDLGIRPWVKLTYLKRPGYLYGIGTGWMVENMQDEIDALHNMRIDGTQLAMLQMYITRRGSGIAGGETFMPLKNIQVDNPKEDFVPIKFPDVGYTTIQAELMAKEYADRATGASDAMMGFENRAVGTRATASGTMFLAQQGSKMFAALEDSVEIAYGEIARVVTFQLLRNAERVRDNFFPLLEEDAQVALDVVLNQDLSTVPTTFYFSVAATDIEKTEEVRRQNMLTLTQLYTMYGEKVFGLLPAIYGPESEQIPPEIKEVAAKFFLGSTAMMDEVFKTFGEVNTRKYLPLVKDLEMMVGAIESMKMQQIGQMAQMQAGAPPQAGGGGGMTDGSMA